MLAETVSEKSLPGIYMCSQDGCRHVSPVYIARETHSDHKFLITFRKLSSKALKIFLKNSLAGLGARKDLISDKNVGVCITEFFI